MLKRLLITGAAGALGRALTPRLRDMAETLRLADIVPVPDALPQDEVVQCDLADAAAVNAMVAGCDGILHLGGISVERPFDPILQGNIVGVYNLYEAARVHGLPRILFASSNHTIGFYKQTERLGPDCTYKPDSLYGVSKIFGEAVAQLYFEKFGQETARVRIGSCTPTPENHRALGSWFSHDDFLSLIRAVFEAPSLGCPVIWGVSDNDAGWWDNSHIAGLWQASDNAETFRAKIEATVALPAADEATRVYQGGIFTTYPIYQKTDA
ncbi:NAD-dependent epimerase/dehydratase family protein [Paracoccus aestuariivivens]|uniref:NAD-dependent epimerase/dehydratase family protein n=1 Tax=Paracoccus aestuariivivens TaxID=1820333 RepID=A0A6L6J5W2_9RHOB|nr:NAD(P)-dependent oxidoreductase [Paracoccus aestuariivivens]MTH77320.1 NAD-dependent epimerase/dehydratase family protein [Paracoccus aestuariivivens]